MKEYQDEGAARASSRRLARLAGEPGQTPVAGPDPGAEPEPAVDSGPPPSPFSGADAFDPGRPGLRALVVVAVAVVLLAAVAAYWARPRPEPVVPQLMDPVAVSGGPAAAAPEELVVAVSGLVREPGLVRLPPGARVADAIDAAGGVLPEAELEHLNLARRLADGELVVVGADPPGPDPAVGGGDPAGPAALVNLNTATGPELETLPGIGPALAQRIIDYRTTQGPFGSVGELRQVSGIGEVRFNELKDLVTV